MKIKNFGWVGTQPLILSCVNAVLTCKNDHSLPTLLDCSGVVWYNRWHQNYCCRINVVYTKVYVLGTLSATQLTSIEKGFFYPIYHVTKSPFFTPSLLTLPCGVKYLFKVQIFWEGPIEKISHFVLTVLSKWE